MKKNLWFVFGGIFFLLAALGASAQNFPSLEADPKAAEYGRAAAAGLSWETLAETALWASGASGGDRSYMSALASAAAELLDPASLPAGEKERGEYVLDFMHKKFLKNYSERQTRLDTLIANGTYNCVSSAVLYAILCAAAGLEIRGVITRDHAFATLVFDGGEIDVETTNPYGFDPGNRREFHDGFGRLTGFAYVPARNYRDRSDINTLELVSLILNNKITEAETRGRFAEALSLALDRKALLSFNTGAGGEDRTYPELFIEPHKMVMDRVFNYGGSLIRAGRDGEALEWADFASPSFPDAKRWDEFTDTALNNLFVKLVRSERFSEAAAELDANVWRSGPLVSARLSSIRKTLAEAELSKLVTSIKNQEEADAALRVLNDNASKLAPEKFRELLVFVILKKGEFTAKEQGWTAAAAFLDAARAEYGSDRRFDEHLRAYRTNRAAELHNNFAAAYNRRDFENARAILAAALEEFPGNSRFEDDAKLLERALR